jgi:hypothetical protein
MEIVLLKNLQYIMVMLLLLLLLLLAVTYFSCVI